MIRPIVTVLALLLPSADALADWNFETGPATIGNFTLASQMDARRTGIAFSCDMAFGAQVIFIPDIAVQPDASGGRVGVLELSVDGTSVARLSAMVGLTPDHRWFRIFTTDPNVIAGARALRGNSTDLKVTFVSDDRPLVWQTFDVTGAKSLIDRALDPCRNR